MNIAQLLNNTTQINSTTPRLDIELLVMFAINKPRSFIYAHPEYELDKAEQTKFSQMLARRIAGEPIAYILGHKEFWSLELEINNNVLIPRPETELLVEIALNSLPDKKITIADLGTGSGAIALALAKERPNWSVIATDISNDALQVARNNATKLGLKNVGFYHGNWCEALPNKIYDAIISNPPYIATHDLHLQQGDLKFEPMQALAIDDGLTALKTIITQAKSKLANGGILILEYGYDQSSEVEELLRANNYYSSNHYRDLNGHYRAVRCYYL